MVLVVFATKDHKYHESDHFKDLHADRVSKTTKEEAWWWRYDTADPKLIRNNISSIILIENGPHLI